MKLDKDKIIEIIWFVGVILLMIWSIKLLNDGTLESKVAAMGLWAPLIIITLKISTLVFAPLGGTPLYIISGALFGVYEGFAICFLGDVAGSAICFGISRKYGEKVVKFLIGKSNFEYLTKILKLLENTKSFLKARVIFIKLPEIFAYAAGISKVRFWKFLFIHSLFFIPIDFLLVLLGSSIAGFSLKYTLLLILGTSVIALGGAIALFKDFKALESS